MDRAAPFIPSFTEQNWQPLDQARNAVFQLDDDGRVLDVNDTACQWLGYSREELLRMTVYDIDPLISHENWQIRREKLRKHRSLSARSQHRRKDGTMYPIELTTTYVEAGDRSYSITVVQDVTQRRAIEEQLRKVVEQFSEAQRVAHVGSWEWDLQIQKAQWSDENYRLFGYEPGQIKPSPQFVISRVHPEDQSRFQEHFEQFAQGHTPFDIEYRLLQPDGSSRYIHSRGQAVRDRAGKVVRLIGAAMDMTARRMAEIEVEAMARRLSDAQRIAHVGSWEWTPDDDTIVWSQEVFRIFGYQPREGRMTREQALSMVHINNMDQLVQSIVAARDEGKSFSLDHMVTRPSGEVCYCHGRGQPVFDASGKVCLVFGTVQDVTDRVRVQHQLEAAMHRLNEAQHVASIGTWEWDLLQHTAFWTDEMYRMYGRDPNDPITIDKAMASVHPDDQQRAQDVVNEAIKRPESFEIEHRVLLPDGSVRYCLGRGQVVHDETGKAVRVFGTSQDVTERKLAELALRRSEEHYRRAAETNRRLLAEVNHRVRNNLSGLLSLLRITREEADDVEQFATLMEQRITAMSKAHNLLADAHWQSLDLLALIRSAAGGYGSDDDGRTIFNGPPTRISPRQVVPLSLALHELFINAAKYGCHSEPAGRLNITWRHDHRKLVLKWCETAGPRIELPIKPSLGTELIRGFIGFELGGTLELNYPPDGANHVLSIPLERESGELMIS